ncbi:hypothetical protein QBC32DRAFT_381271 [Pseudoneurospora amorphoporcata]|uniref:Uncharacterized protein n=1 Tax=Pseudoneurospora amorphoporcata TaxID=241081 RepID=A0AAN6P1S1_9PEZI|nr:hypothetical protein QBC32DRAFT_381271 [Pseudoneurospora amorphoporcata]
MSVFPAAPRLEPQPQPHVPAAGPSMLRRNLKIFFLLVSKPKCSTCSRLPALLLHCFFALSLYRPAMCWYVSECDALISQILDFAWVFMLMELLVFFQRALLTAFHEYRRLLQHERDEDGTEENEAQFCDVCDPARSQASRPDGLTSAEALAFLRVLVVLELVFSLVMNTEFLFTVEPGQLWELRNHEGVNNERGDDLEKGSSAAVEAGVAVLSPVFGPGLQNEIQSEYLRSLACIVLPVSSGA